MVSTSAAGTISVVTLCREGSLCVAGCWTSWPVLATLDRRGCGCLQHADLAFDECAQFSMSLGDADGAFVAQAARGLRDQYRDRRPVDTRRDRCPLARITIVTAAVSMSRTRSAYAFNWAPITLRWLANAMNSALRIVSAESLFISHSACRGSSSVSKAACASAQPLRPPAAPPGTGRPSSGSSSRPGPA